MTADDRNIGLPDDPNASDPGAANARTDDDLRGALASLDPATEYSTADPSGVNASAALDSAWMRVQQKLDPGGEAPSPADRAAAPPTRRRWWELAAAACLGAALVGGAVAATQSFTVDQTDTGAVTAAPGAAPGDAATDGAVSAEVAPNGAVSDGAAPNSVSSSSASIARSASATVATEQLLAARDSYVATITGLGGRVTSETVTTTGGGNGAVEPMPADIAIYPPIYSGAGIYLDMEVPTAQYEQAVAAIAPLGEVIEVSQSSYDTGTSIVEGEARIGALQESLTRLEALLTQAESVNEVIEVENAIAARQSELDALTAQQRYLAGQVEQARISLRLLTPQDVQELSSGPETWWEQFTAGVADAWMWLGRALAWTSPLWIGGLLCWLLSHRRAGSAPTGTVGTS